MILGSRPKFTIGTDFVIIGIDFSPSLFFLLGVKNFYKALLLASILSLLLSFLLIDELFFYLI